MGNKTKEKLGKRYLISLTERIGQSNIEYAAVLEIEDPIEKVISRLNRKYPRGTSMYGVEYGAKVIRKIKKGIGYEITHSTRELCKYFTERMHEDDTLQLSNDNW